MKKIPTVFKRIYKNHRVIDCAPEFTSDITKTAFLTGNSTIKFDGACCAYINNEFYKRYDAKKGKRPPQGAIPCCDPDPVTGHWPHWVKLEKTNPADKWFFSAIHFTKELKLLKFSENATYEAIGLHFNSNPYELNYDCLVKHGSVTIEVPKTYDEVKLFLQELPQEGIVYWLNGEPAAKLKRTDFGYKWPLENKENL